MNIAIDFDRTLATFNNNIYQTGEPIVPVIEKVKEWIARGHKVTIFTARVSDEMKDESIRSQSFRNYQKFLIEEFLTQNGLPKLDITANKSPKFDVFIDDKAIPVQNGKFLISLDKYNLN